MLQDEDEPRGLSFSCTVNQQGGTSAFLDLGFWINTPAGHKAHGRDCACNSYSGMDGLSQLFYLRAAFFSQYYYYYYYSVKWIQQQNHRAVGQIKALKQTSVCPGASQGYHALQGKGQLVTQAGLAFG